MTPPLSRVEARNYWIQRHVVYLSDWKSTGFLGGSEAVNRAFYKCRLEALKKILRHKNVNLAGKCVLDVGCGLGAFAQYYHACGAQVFGIDISPDAIAYCNNQRIGTFVEGDAASAATKFNRTFDLIHCFDVLYHLTDEQGWRATLEAFAQVSHPGTIWVFTEFRVYKTRTAAPHMVKRSTDTYRTELALYGRQIVEETPLYWLYSAWPWLGQRIPSLISKVEWLGRFFGGLFPHESVVLWVIQE
jgi:2-polyprenyl-3-methyl-5-hydroxy-6-metoxy-1,4-benzoquinol methylase